MTHDKKQQVPAINELQLEALLKSLPSFERDRAKDRAFLKMLHEKANREPASSRDAELDNSSAGIWHWFSWKKLTLGTSFALVFLMAGTTVWAYQPSTTRGHFLYGLKQAGEKIELALAGDAIDTVQVHLNFSDRRLAEADVIVSQSPGLAWFIPAANAGDTGGDGDYDNLQLDSQDEINLAATLADMQRELSFASDVIEKHITVPHEVENALSRIETVVDRHTDHLQKLEQRKSEKARKLFEKMSDDEDEYLAYIIEIRETAKEAVALKQDRLEVRFALRPGQNFFAAAPIEAATAIQPNHETSDDAATSASVPVIIPADASVTPAQSDIQSGRGIIIKIKRAPQHKTEAQEEFKQMLQLINELPREQRQDFEETFEMARHALETERFGKAKGLSRVLQQRVKKMEKRAERDDGEREENSQQQEGREIRRQPAPGPVTGTQERLPTAPGKILEIKPSTMIER